MNNFTGRDKIITGYIQKISLPSGKVKERYRKNIGTETKSCVLHCLTVVEKSVIEKCQSKWSWNVTPCLCKHNREHVLYSNAALEVILMLPSLGIYIEGTARQATYRLNCSGKFWIGQSMVYDKMPDEWPSFQAPGDKIVPIITFCRGFRVQLAPKSSWLIRETSKILSKIRCLHLCFLEDLKTKNTNRCKSSFHLLTRF
jgi:hypothetical protein